MLTYTHVCPLLTFKGDHQHPRFGDTFKILVYNISQDLVMSACDSSSDGLVVGEVRLRLADILAICR
jgi:hypothetical protein